MSRNSRRAAVVVTVGAHVAYLLYLPSGGFLALRWQRGIIVHIPAVLWGVAVVVFGVPCPLTTLERRMRDRAGMDPLPASGFVDRYVDGVVYPAGRTGFAQAVAFAAAAVSWVAFASKTTRHQQDQLASRP